MQDTRTRLHRLIEERLDGTLADFVEKRRAASASWRSIARDVTDATGIEISHMAVRGWFGDHGEVAA